MGVLARVVHDAVERKQEEVVVFKGLGDGSDAAAIDGHVTFSIDGKPRAQVLGSEGGERVRADRGHSDTGHAAAVGGVDGGGDGGTGRF